MHCFWRKDLISLHFLFFLAADAVPNKMNRYFAECNISFTVLNYFLCVLIEILLKYDPWGLVDNTSSVL